MTVAAQHGMDNLAIERIVLDQQDSQGCDAPDCLGGLSDGVGSSCEDRPKCSMKRKILPWPGVLSTQMRPPIISTKRRQIDSPRPVPP